MAICMKHISAKLCLLMALLLLISACQPKRPPLSAQPPADPRLAWTAFVARSEQAFMRSGPFRLNGSLRYTLPDGTSERVSCLVWGNDASGPLRLDLTAGIGTVVGKAQESSEGFLAYIPSEKTAYSHDQVGSSLESLGVPIPLSLSELTHILTGGAGQLFLPDGADIASPPTVVGGTESSVIFGIQHARLSGELELANNGDIIAWRDGTMNGWTFTFTPSVTPLRPKRLVISHAQGYKAIISISDVTLLDQPYSAKQLMLTVPPGTQLQGL